MNQYNTGTGVNSIDPLFIPSLSGNNQLVIVNSDGQVVTTTLSADTLTTLNDSLGNFDFSDYALQADLTTLSNAVKNIAGADLSSYTLKTTFNTTSNNLATLSNLYIKTSNVVNTLSNANLSGYTLLSQFTPLSNNVSTLTSNFTSLSNYTSAIVNNGDLSGLSNAFVKLSNQEVIDRSNISTLANYANLLATGSNLDLSGYATVTSLTSLSNVVKGLSNADLSGYATTTQFTTLSNAVSTLSNADLSAYTLVSTFTPVSNLAVQNSNTFAQYTKQTDFVSLSNYTASIISAGDTSGFTTLSVFNILSNQEVIDRSNISTIATFASSLSASVSDYSILSNNYSSTSNFVDSIYTNYSATSNLLSTLSNADLSGYATLSNFTPVSNLAIQNSNAFALYTKQADFISLSNYTASIISAGDTSGFTTLSVFYTLSNQEVIDRSNISTIATFASGLSSSVSDYGSLSNNFVTLQNSFTTTSNLVATLSNADLSGYTQLSKFTPVSNLAITTSNNLVTLKACYTATSNLVSTLSNADLSAYTLLSSFTPVSNLAVQNSNTFQLYTKQTDFVSLSNYTKTIISGSDTSGFTPLTSFTPLSNQEVLDRSNISTVAGFINVITSNLIDTATLSNLVIVNSNVLASLSNKYVATSNQEVIDRACILQNSNNIVSLSNYVCTFTPNIDLSGYATTISLTNLSNLYTATSNAEVSDKANIVTLSNNFASYTKTSDFVILSNFVGTLPTTTTLLLYTPLTSYTATSNAEVTDRANIATNASIISTNSTNILNLSNLYIATSNAVVTDKANIATNTSIISTNSTYILNLSNLYTATSNAEVTDRTNITGLSSTVSANTTNILNLSNLYTATSNAQVIDQTNIASLSNLYTATSNYVATLSTGGGGGGGSVDLSGYTLLTQYTPTSNQEVLDRSNINTLAGFINSNVSSILTLSNNYYSSSNNCVTLSGTQTLTNKTLDGSLNTFTNLPASTVGIPGRCDFRLTLQTGTAVPNLPSLTAKNIVYFTNYRGSHITLWNGTAWQDMSSGEISITLSGLTTSRAYDVFAYISGSTVALELGVAYTSVSSRGSPVSLKDGVYVKTADNTRLFVGTFRTTSTTTTEDSYGGANGSGGNRFLWNYFNRVPRKQWCLDTGAAYSYTNNTNRGVRNVLTYVCNYWSTENEGYDASIQNVVCLAGQTAETVIATQFISENGVNPASSALCTGAINVNASNAYFYISCRAIGAFTTAGLGILYWMETGASSGTCIFTPSLGNSKAAMFVTTNG